MNSLRQALPSLRVILLVAVVSLVALGCASHRNEHFNEKVMAPEPPEFLMSPVSILLSTPSDGLTADVLVEEPGSFRTNKIAGKLFVKGSNLLFSPKKSDRTFIWDSATHQGFVLSEALQGYAGTTSVIFADTLQTKSETAGTSSERVNGYEGHEAEVTVKFSDGNETTVSVWRTKEFSGFPARLAIPGKAGTQIVNLSKIQFTTVSDHLFNVPEGFTAYRSVVAMTSELMIRQSKARNNRPVSGDRDSDEGNTGPVHAPEHKL